MQSPPVLLVGPRWSAETHDLKDFLARNLVPYRWLNVETSEEARRLAWAHGGAAALPLVIFPEGDPLRRPSQTDVAERLGLQTEASRPFYDLAIVGGGPAGLAAAVYGASEGLRTVLVECEAPGGQAGTSSRIENYLGFPDGISGAELAQRAVAQARKFEAEVLTPVKATALRPIGRYHLVELSTGDEIACHALLIATGMQWRMLEAPGAEALTGRGIYYGAAMAEAVACRNEDVYLIGGGNSAGQAAMHIARYARSVELVARCADLAETMSQYLIEQIEATENVHVRLQTEVVRAEGEERLERITLRNVESEDEEEAEAHTLFVFIGAEPHTDWLGDVLLRDEDGFILTGTDLADVMQDWPANRDPYLLETCRPGVFAAGDVRHGSIKRVASSVGEGSVAISFVHQYLASM